MTTKRNKCRGKIKVFVSVSEHETPKPQTPSERTLTARLLIVIRMNNVINVHCY